MTLGCSQTLQRSQENARTGQKDFVFIFSHQEGLSWQLHAFHSTDIAFCLLSSFSVLCTV